MYSCEPLHMDEKMQDHQLEPTYNNSVPIRNGALKTCRKRWTIKTRGERGSAISVLMVQHDIYIYIYIYIYMYIWHKLSLRIDLKGTIHKECINQHILTEYSMHAFIVYKNIQICIKVKKKNFNAEQIMLLISSKQI